jgi:hypothetical protein
MRFKYPQNGAKLGLKQPQEIRGIKLGRCIGKEDTCKEKTTWLALGTRLTGG